MQRNQIDGAQMRWLENKAREIGRLIVTAINQTGRKYGFCLLLFSFDGPELTYLSNAERASMIKALEEFLERQKKGEAGQLWHERN